MGFIDRLDAFNRVPASALDWLQSPFALALRLYVSWQFLKSGLVKIESWDSTLWLFENEYRTPLLSPTLAAWLGTAGELVFPILVALGLLGRLGALGLFAVNAMAVVAYSHFLLADGSEAALGQHVLWGVMLLVIAVYGPGKLSLDYLIQSGNERGGIRRGPRSPSGAAVRADR
jgi:putative oxidoreductase